MKKESEYKKKRDFSKTKEPEETNKKGGSHPIFVIQKHDATNLHYDVRFEIDNTLKSWSVPKGPSTNPKIKRMAIPTEDHPIAYADFEGTIPKDQYGGGTVMVWDTGTIENLKKDADGKSISLKKSYEMGTIEIHLNGKKLQGGYGMIKMKTGPMKGNWLFIKLKDEFADARRNSVNTEKNSAISGRTMAEIAKEDQ